MDDLLERSARELVALMASRELSSRELTAVHLAQIDALNPQINAIVTVDPARAMAEATAADETLVAGEQPGPLHGLPMTHKDTHAVAWMRTTQGSPLFAEHVPEVDDRIIARLRRSGVVSTGKSNVPEFAAGSHTFNEVFGTTVNPFDLSRSAGGSSGGLAAALAARIQPLGEGSDMGGSLRIPASFCNVYGFRPSYGAIPSFPPQHRSAWLARQGPMARGVGDLQLMMRAVSGPADSLPWVRSVTPRDFTDEGAETLRGVKIGYTTDFGLAGDRGGSRVPVEPEAAAAVARAASVLEDLGAVVAEESIDFAGADEVFHVERAFDFVTTLGDTVRRNPERVKPEVLWNTREGFGLDAERMVTANALSASLQDSVQRFFNTYDLLLSPGAQVVPFDATLRYPERVGTTDMSTYLDWMRAASLLSATGLPTLAMPAGFTGSRSLLSDVPKGLPTGVQLTAPHYADGALLWWARAYDAHDKVRGWSSTMPDILCS